MAYELPFILWTDIFYSSSIITTSGTDSNYPVDNMIDKLDYTYWKSSDSNDPYIDINKGGSDYGILAFAGQNFDTVGVTRISVYKDTSASFSSPTLIYERTYPPDYPFYAELSSNSGNSYLRIQFSLSSNLIQIPVLWLGNKMEIPVGPEFNFDMMKQEIQSEKYLNYSGRMISSALKYSKRMIQCEFKRLSETFCFQSGDNSLFKFLEFHYGQMKPFFFCPDPGQELSVNLYGVDPLLMYLVAPDNPTINLPIYEDDIGFRNWTLEAQGIRYRAYWD